MDVVVQRQRIGREKGWEEGAEGRWRQRRKRKGHTSLSFGCDRVVTDVGIMECFTDGDPDFQYQTKVETKG